MIAKFQTQFNTSIRILLNDNMKEYLSMPFSFFMSSSRILRQSSCAHNPHQNGANEHKNCHLVEMTRTLLLHNNVRLRF